MEAKKAKKAAKAAEQLARKKAMDEAPKPDPMIQTAAPYCGVLVKDLLGRDADFVKLPPGEIYAICEEEEARFEASRTEKERGLEVRGNIDYSCRAQWPLKLLPLVFDEWHVQQKDETEIMRGFIRMMERARYLENREELRYNEDKLQSYCVDVYHRRNAVADYFLKLLSRVVDHISDIQTAYDYWMSRANTVTTRYGPEWFVNKTVDMPKPVSSITVKCLVPTNPRNTLWLRAEYGKRVTWRIPVDMCILSALKFDGWKFPTTSHRILTWRCRTQNCCADGHVYFSLSFQERHRALCHAYVIENSAYKDCCTHDPKCIAPGLAESTSKNYCYP
jgi:hypothetical protein